MGLITGKTEVRLVQAHYSEVQDLGHDLLRLLHIPGETEANSYAIEHHCKIVGDVQLLIAPVLSLHEVSGDWPRVTIRPSVACPDCGLHGMITMGSWEPV